MPDDYLPPRDVPKWEPQPFPGVRNIVKRAWEAEHGPEPKAAQPVTDEDLEIDGD
jgi:hypothetical protein